MSSLFFSKTLLVFTPLLLLPYSFNTQALSATTANTIQGTSPYLTFDGGATKVTTTDGLLSIKLSDGTIITPSTNTSTISSPITLPVVGQSFADIEMLIPADTTPVSSGKQEIKLTDVIGTPYNYWGDDDGGMSTLFHTTKLRGNCLLNAIGVK